MGATWKRDLRSDHSIWQRRALLRFPERRLPKDTRCDVLVIGAGITGAMAAEQLTDAGLSVIVLDRRGAVRGSTLASTALLQYEIDTPLTTLTPRIGRTRAERIWRRSRLAVDALRDRTRRLGIAADCTDKTSLYLEGNVLDAAGLRAEATARRLRSLPAFRQCRPRRVRHPGPYRPSQRPQSRSQPAAPGSGLSADGAGARRPTIRARHVVFATGYELPKGVPRKGHRIATTWVIATRAQPRGLWAGHGFI